MRPDNVEFILCYSSPPTKFDVLQTFKLFSKDNMVNRLEREVQFINETQMLLIFSMPSILSQPWKIKTIGDDPGV